MTTPRPDTSKRWLTPYCWVDEPDGTCLNIDAGLLCDYLGYSRSRYNQDIIEQAARQIARDDLFVPFRVRYH